MSNLYNQHEYMVFTATGRRERVLLPHWFSSKSGGIIIFNHYSSARQHQKKRGKPDCKKHHQSSKWDYEQQDPYQQGITNHASAGDHSTAHRSQSFKQRYEVGRQSTQHVSGEEQTVPNLLCRRLSSVRVYPKT